MKRYLLLAILALSVSAVEAALINRTYTYTDGNTLSANENNTNETTLYNEVNGQLDAANVENGTLLNEDIADTQIERAKFSSTVQSTFTYIETLGAYRRPRLTYISATTVDVENNSPTSNQTCIHFPNQRRCVTENTASTSVNRRAIITETASFTGTKNSGLAPGEAEAANTWYAAYAVKVQDNATDFVIALSTNQPTQGNASTLTTLFGTDGFVYLGMVRNGDSISATTDIVSFRMSGNVTYFDNALSASQTIGPGILQADSGGATTVTWTYTTGFGTAHIPANVGSIYFCGGGGSLLRMGNTAGTVRYYSFAAAPNISACYWAAAGTDQRVTNNTSTTATLAISGFSDAALGIGYNPQL